MSDPFAEAIARESKTGDDPFARVLAEEERKKKQPAKSTAKTDPKPKAKPVNSGGILDGTNLPVPSFLPPVAPAKKPAPRPAWRNAITEKTPPVANLESEKDAIQKTAAALRLQKRSLDTRDKAAVDAFNQKVKQLGTRIQTFQKSVEGAKAIFNMPMTIKAAPAQGAQAGPYTTAQPAPEKLGPYTAAEPDPQTVEMEQKAREIRARLASGNRLGWWEKKKLETQAAALEEGVKIRKQDLMTQPPTDDHYATQMDPQLRNLISSPAKVVAGIGGFIGSQATTAMDRMLSGVAAVLPEDEKQRMQEQVALAHEYDAHVAANEQNPIIRGLAQGAVHPMSNEELLAMPKDMVKMVIDGITTLPTQVKTGDISPFLMTALTVWGGVHGAKNFMKGLEVDGAVRNAAKANRISVRQQWQRIAELPADKQRTIAEEMFGLTSEGKPTELGQRMLEQVKKTKPAEQGTPTVSLATAEGMRLDRIAREQQNQPVPEPPRPPAAGDLFEVPSMVKGGTGTERVRVLEAGKTNPDRIKVERLDEISPTTGQPKVRWVDRENLTNRVEDKPAASNTAPEATEPARAPAAPEPVTNTGAPEPAYRPAYSMQPEPGGSFKPGDLVVDNDGLVTGRVTGDVIVGKGDAAQTMHTVEILSGNGKGQTTVLAPNDVTRVPPELADAYMADPSIVVRLRNAAADAGGAGEQLPLTPAAGEAPVAADLQPATPAKQRLTAAERRDLALQQSIDNPGRFTIPEMPDAAAGAAPQGGSGYGKRNSYVTDQAYNQAKADFLRKMGKLGSIPDPTSIKELVEMAAYHAEAAGREFGDFVSRMAQDLGDFWNQLTDKQKQDLFNAGGAHVEQKVQENIARGTQAMEHTLGTHQDVLDAMRRDPLGQISFLWGDETGGVQHLIERRNIQGYDGEAIARRMVEVIARGEIGEITGPPGGERVRITLGDATAVLSLYRFGEKVTWLLTGWDDTAPGGSGRGYGLSGPTPAGPMRTRPDGGAGASQPDYTTSGGDTNVPPAEPPGPTVPPGGNGSGGSGGADVPGELPKYAGNINLQRLDTGDDVKRTILEVVGDLGMGPKWEDRTRRWSWAETEAAANEMGMTLEDVRKLSPGRPLNQVEIHQLRDLYVSYAEDVHAARRAFRAVDSSENKAKLLLATQQFDVVNQALRGTAADAGRALNIYKKMAEAMTYGERAYAEIKKMFGGEELSEQIITDLARIPEDDYTGLMNYMRNIRKASTAEKLHAYLYASMLSAPSTHITNALGNALFMIQNIGIESPVAVAADAVFAKLFHRERTMFMRALPAHMSGVLAGVPIGFRRAMYIWREGFSEADAMALDLGRTEVLGGGAKNPFNWPGRELTASDAVSKEMARSGYIAFHAMNKALGEGLKGDELTQRAKYLMENQPSEMMTRADDFAKYATFTNELGPYSKKLASMLNVGLSDSYGKHLKGLKPLKIIVPFVQVPMNIINAGFERSPLGLTRLFRKDVRARTPAAYETQAYIAARAVIGSGFLAYALTKAQAGDLAGAPPRNQSARDDFYRSGKQPFSIKIGDTWVPYQKLGPLAAPLHVAAGFYSRFDTTGEAPDAGHVWTAVGTVGAGIVDNTWLSGVASLVDALEDPERYGSRLGASVLGQFVPMGALLRNVSGWLDDTSRDTRAYEGEGVMAPVAKQLQAGIPGLAQQLPERLDVYGNPVHRQGRTGPWSFMPFGPSKDTRDATEREISRLGLYPGFTGKSLTIGRQKIDLDQAQHSAYQKAIGQAMLKSAGIFVNSPVYQELNDEQRKFILDKIIQQSRSDAQQIFKAKLYKSLSPRQRAGD